MSKTARKELLLSLQPQYQQASWSEKKQVLDGFVAATGYDRKYAIVLFNQGQVAEKRQSRQRKRKYGADIRELLIEIWSKAGNRLCSKRLVAILPTLIEKMEKFGHLDLSDAQRLKLLSLSPATVDRLLVPERKKYGRGKSTTKPGFLLKKQIAVRTFSEWNDVQPGFVEADLVAHCGESVSGWFLHTLTVTDIATCWTELAALLRKSETQVISALDAVRAAVPFPLLGLDTDNGSEFINYALLNWCKQHRVTFTRAREYKKNDQAHVEEKNGSIVRRLIGYDRYEGVESCRLLSELYRVARLYINFFQPSVKLLSKSRDGAHVYRRYDKAQTPFERVLKSLSVSEQNKERLRREFDSLDPVFLLSEIERLQMQFWRTATVVAHQSDSENAVVEEGHEAKEAAQESPTPNPTRQRRSRAKQVRRVSPETRPRGRKSNLDEVWNEVNLELEKNPRLTAKQILLILDERYPAKFTPGQLSTITGRLRLLRKIANPNYQPRRGRISSIDEVWPDACEELERNPRLSLNALAAMLCERYPDKCRMTQIATIARKLKVWRAQRLQSITVLSVESSIPERTQ